jgi:hypothetical protein
MAHVDDRIQARAQKIALTAVAPLSRLHPILSANHLCAERITKPICKESADAITFSGKSVPHQFAVSDSNSTAPQIFTDDSIIDGDLRALASQHVGRHQSSGAPADDRDVQTAHA